MSAWHEWTRTQLASIEAIGQWRSLVAFDGNGLRARVHGREVINFASNDYLGLASHPDVRAAAKAAIDRWGTGSGASRLVTGTRSLHAELESEIASWKGVDKALVFPTGYAANVGVLTAFGAEDATIFSDALNHASIVDGCRLARARAVVFPHNDLARLASLLDETPGRKLVVTEAVFSMDGDQAPLRELAELCSRHGALLVIDEAHAVLDIDFQTQLRGVDYLLIGTLSKTLGSLGGWVAGPTAAIDLLINRARTFIFTTGLTPGDAAAALAAIKIYRGAEGASLRQRLRRHIDALRVGHPSPILPFILGEEATALRASKSLLERGIYVPAIRPPTVPRGTSRLRLTLSAAHTDDMVAQLKVALAELPTTDDVKVAQ